MTLQHEPRSFSLGEIVRLVSDGSIALPEFQREFVWDPNQVLDLLDSVANGWPIGSLLVLEGPQPFGIKQLEAGPAVDRDSVRYYLLDGQQRVTSLFHALTDTGDYIYYVDFAESSDDDVPRVRWASRKRGIPRYRRPTSVTVAALIEPLAFDEYLSQQAPDDVDRLVRARSDRLGHLLGQAYQVPATLMFSDIDLEALTRIFESLNRTGVRLDAFDLMVAVLYPSGFHLRDAWEAASDAHPVLERLGVDGLEVLKLIALWQRQEQRRDNLLPASRRVLGVRQRDVLRTPPSFVEEHWTAAVTSMAEGLGFLIGEAGVRDAGGVPSSAMALTLAHLVREGVGLRQIRLWYWTAIADQRYLQGANTQVVADVDLLERGSTIGDEDFNTALAQMTASLSEPVRRNRILRLGLRGLLVHRGALDPLTGERLGQPSTPADQITDVSLHELLLGRVGYPSARPVVDLLVLTKASERALRVRLREELPLRLLDPISLESQAIPMVSTYGDEWAAQRVDLIRTWMELAP